MSTRNFVDVFEANRQFLLGLAYRLLGRYTEAEDLVQETYLRWHRLCLENVEVRNPKAYLSRILTRLFLDYQRSARVRKEEYVGPWLPEPVLENQLQPVAQEDGGASVFEGFRDLSYALMLTLERLSPLERAAFILHDVFSMPFSEIALSLGKTEAACRQLASRARKHIREDKKRFAVQQELLDRLIPAFKRAVDTQDMASLSELLARDAVLYSDGGGLVPAALLPIYGSGRILGFLAGVWKKFAPEYEIKRVMLNGEPALCFWRSSVLEQVFMILRNESAQVSEICVIRSPEKLKHLGDLSST